MKTLRQDCIVWQGALTDDGYGPHRNVYRKAKGPIPHGFEIDHLCRNTTCINLNHLEAVPRAVNRARSKQRGKTHHNSQKTRCKHGHLLQGENLRTITNVSGRVWRQCVQCYKTTYSKQTHIPTGQPSNRAKTHCLRGHPLSGTNLRVSTWTGSPKRYCKKCKAIHRTTYKARKRAKVLAQIALAHQLNEREKLHH